MRAPSKNQQSPLAKVISRDQAAALLMLTPQRLDQLVREGWIRKPARGQYNVHEVVQGYLRFRQDGLDRKAAGSEEANNLLDARTRLLDHAIAKRDAELIDSEEHEAITRELVGMVREVFETLPDRLPASFPKDIRETARAQVAENLDALDRRLAELNAELRATGSTGEGAAEQ